MSWKTVVDAFTGDMSPETRRAVLRWTMYMFFVAFTLYSCGNIPTMDGFALAEDVKNTKEEVEDVKEEVIAKIEEIDNKLDNMNERFSTLEITLLEDRIEATQRRRCNATSPELRRQHIERLQRLLNKYATITQRNYPLQAC